MTKEAASNYVLMTSGFVAQIDDVLEKEANDDTKRIYAGLGFLAATLQEILKEMLPNLKD